MTQHIHDTMTQAEDSRARRADKASCGSLARSVSPLVSVQECLAVVTSVGGRPHAAAGGSRDGPLGRGGERVSSRRRHPSLSCRLKNGSRGGLGAAEQAQSSEAASHMV